jgi:hypothetical protein
MNDDGADAVIRRAIGGDAASIASILAGADMADDAVTIAMAALLQGDSRRLNRADSVAVTSRERQVVAIARAHLAGDSELVDALARDHLVSFPASLIVSWIASGPEPH